MINENVEEEKKTCSHCNKSFATDLYFNSHSCRIPKNDMDELKRKMNDSKNVIDEYKTKIRELEDRLISVNTITNNNITNNNNGVESIVENYTKPLTKYNKKFEKLNVDEIREQMN